MRSGGLAVLLLALACASSGAAGSKKWKEFDAYPGARQLCSEHVTGQGMHLEWQSYATADAPAAVKAFYRKRMPGKVSGDFTVEASPDLKLSVHDAATPGYPTCGEAPRKGEATVIVVSLAIR